MTNTLLIFKKDGWIVKNKEDLIISGDYPLTEDEKFKNKIENETGSKKYAIEYDGYAQP